MENREVLQHCSFQLASNTYFCKPWPKIYGLDQLWIKQGQKKNMVFLQQLIFSFLLETCRKQHKVIAHIFQPQRCPNCLVKQGINTKPLQERARGREISKELVWEEIEDKKPSGQRKSLSIRLKVPVLLWRAVLGQQQEEIWVNQTLGTVKWPPRDLHKRPPWPWLALEGIHDPAWKILDSLH